MLELQHIPEHKLAEIYNNLMKIKEELGDAAVNESVNPLYSPIP